MRPISFLCYFTRNLLVWISLLLFLLGLLVAFRMYRDWKNSRRMNGTYSFYGTSADSMAEDLDRKKAADEFVSYVGADGYEWIRRDSGIVRLFYQGRTYEGILVFSSDGTDNSYNRVKEFLSDELVLEGVPEKKIPMEMLVSDYSGRITGNIAFFERIAVNEISKSGEYFYDTRDLNGGRKPNERELEAICIAFSDIDFVAEQVGDSVVRLTLCD